MDRSEQCAAQSGEGLWNWIRRLLLAGGLGLIALVATVELEHRIGEGNAFRAFAVAETSPGEAVPGNAASAQLMKRLLAENESAPGVRHSLPSREDPTLALLEIPTIHLVAPVLNGTDGLTLNHGVGRIAGTAMPGQGGNLALAGHRDSYFRGLKDLQRGDPIRLRTHGGVDTYSVDRFEIVSPENVSVLKTTEEPSLTLITCYPFRFLGNAPQRFVVTAHRTRHITVGSQTTDTRSHHQPSNPTQEEL